MCSTSAILRALSGLVPEAQFFVKQEKTGGNASHHASYYASGRQLVLQGFTTFLGERGAIRIHHHVVNACAVNEPHVPFRFQVDPLVDTLPRLQHAKQAHGLGGPEFLVHRRLIAREFFLVKRAPSPAVRDALRQVPAAHIGGLERTSEEHTQDDGESRHTALSPSVHSRLLSERMYEAHCFSRRYTV